MSHIDSLTLQYSIDILRIPDANAFAYQHELRNLASSLGLKHLEFVRPGTLVGIVSKDAQTLEEYSAQVQQTRSLLDGQFSQEIDSFENENTQAISKHYDTALPNAQDPEAFKAAMLKRGKVRVSCWLSVAY